MVMKPLMKPSARLNKAEMSNRYEQSTTKDYRPDRDGPKNPKPFVPPRKPPVGESTSQRPFAPSRNPTARESAQVQARLQAMQKKAGK